MENLILENGLVPSVNRILVVEDDSASRNYLEVALKKMGYAAVGAEGAAQARERLAYAHTGAFSCVLTDFCMPDQNGLELMAWIKEQDPSLATIIITAAGEKNLVAESLRGGAIDYLDKPVTSRQLQDAVARAIDWTNHQRHLTQSESAVKALRQAQQRMFRVDASQTLGRVEICSFPCHEAGGDFFSCFQTAPDRLFCLLTDVSGHDPLAAYISAYFQGLARGLLTRGASAASIFPDFNRFLLEEWRGDGSVPGERNGFGTSVAACALLIDATTRTADIFNYGMPAPVYYRPDGESGIVGDEGGFPLGWFPDLSLGSAPCSIACGGSFLFWTDGLLELAKRQGVSVLSMAYALRRAHESNLRPSWMNAAADDVLLIAVHPSSAQALDEAFEPLISERYSGACSAEIDTLQAFWKRSLMMALPDLTEETLHDILLASRETVLNALLHGCAHNPEKTATFQAAWCRQHHALRIRVQDPGEGHQFDLDKHTHLMEKQLPEKHYGLFFISHLASTVEFGRNGADVVMNFNDLKP